MNRNQRTPRIFRRLAVIVATATLAASAHAADTTLIPAAGASNICPDTPLQIQLQNPPTLGKAGKITITDTATHEAVDTIDLSSPTATETIGGVEGFNYYPVTVTGNTLTIYPHNHALDYGKTYAVSIDADALPDAGRISDWTFTTRASGPAAGAAKLNVAADGSGDFCTVQAALDFIPDGNTSPVTINIRNGVYNEIVVVQNKNNITLAGEDRKQTVIQYPNNNKFNNSAAGHVYHRGMLLAAHCNDLTIQNLTLHNTTPRGGSQAEAIILNGTLQAHAILRDVDLYSYQDTLQINGQAYLSNCYIEGDVDFMWGSGPCFFDHCHCTATRTKGYYTQIRNTNKNHGYIYSNCVFDGSPGVQDVYLSRIAPQTFPYSEVVLLNCTESATNPVGWLLNGPKGKPAADLLSQAGNVHFWEYNCKGPDGQPLDTSKRLSISKQLTDAQDADTIKQYSNPAFVLGGWNPTAATGTSNPSHSLHVQASHN